MHQELRLLRAILSGGITELGLTEDLSVPKPIEKIMQMAEDLDAETMARLAGELLNNTPMDGECCEAFLAELSETNKSELACRLNDEA